MTEREKILEGLELLFEQAEHEGLWFYSPYQRLWFSPAELRAHHERGKFRWGACNWQLRDPKERLRELEADVETAKAAVSAFLKRMSGEATDK